MANQIAFGDECLIKTEDMAGGSPHSDWIPPGFVNRDRWISKITGKKKVCRRRGGAMSGATWSRCAYQEDGPSCSACASGEGLASFNNVSSLNFPGNRAEALV